MGCVLQPGEAIPAAALKPGDTTSESVQPGQDIDFCAPPVAPETLNLTNTTVQEFSTAPAIGNKLAGYELQGNGGAFTLRADDDGAGPPNFAQPVPTDFVDPKPGAGTYHVRFTQTGGNATIAQGTLNVWLEIGVASTLVTIEEPNGSGFRNWIGTAELSEDGGSSTVDTANITLETDEI